MPQNPEICCGELRNLANWMVKFGKICLGKLWALDMHTGE